MNTCDSELTSIIIAISVEMPPLKTAGPIEVKVETIRSFLLPFLWCIKECAT
jgi:hypothetical protein